LAQFCQLAIKFILDGFDRQLFMSAATQFGLSPEPLKKAIEALCFLFAESARLNLSALDFADSLLVLAFAADLTTLLAAQHAEHSKRIRLVLAELTFDVPHYVDLHWRLDVLLASRALRNQTKPLFLLQLDTRTDHGVVQSRFVEVDPTDLRHIASELDSALNELKTAPVRRVLRNVK
jgi:hypothetical protein